MRACMFNTHALRSASALLVRACYVLNYAHTWFKFRIFVGTLFPTYVVDDLAALVLGSGCQTKWFGLSYDIKHVLYHFSYFVHDFPYATLVNYYWKFTYLCNSVCRFWICNFYLNLLSFSIFYLNFKWTNVNLIQKVGYFLRL